MAKQAKKWKPGCADEPWKVLILGRDLHLIDSAWSHLRYILTDCGNDVERGDNAISEMSGEEIVRAVGEYKAHIEKCIARALPPRKD